MEKFLLSLFLLIFQFSYSLGEQGDEQSKPRSCSKFEFNTLWSSSLRNSPLMATPLLIDVDGDSLRDIIAPSYSGEVYAIHGENGHIVDNWPFYLEDRAFYASPLAYDFDSDGTLDILLTTTDAEIIFLKTDNTLFHGETIKIPPIRVNKQWYMLDKENLENLISELTKQIGDRFIPLAEDKPLPPDDNARPTRETFSSIEEQIGNKADPLFSRHYPQERPSGVDPNDNDYVFVDPHVLATPVLADLNEDGSRAELVVPVTYYFDSFQYGDPARLAKTRLSGDELKLYCVEGIVVIDLESGKIVYHRVLGLTKVDSNQPAYLLNSPTVVKLSADSPMSIIIGSVTGKLYVLEGQDLGDRPGFPLTMDSISAQVAVEDIVGNDGVLEMVIGDSSGNIVCISSNGRRVWEHEAKGAVESSVRFANITPDNFIEVVFVTKYGDLWILNGSSGTPVGGYPMVLNTLVHSSVFLMHLTPKTSSNDYRLSAIVPAVDGMYVVDLYGGCVDKISTKDDTVPHTLQSDHIDPFNPGIEVLSTTLTGDLLLFSTSTIQASDYDVSVNSWPAETSAHGNSFTHKQSSFALVCGRGLTPRDAIGMYFKMAFHIYDNHTSVTRPHDYYLQVYVGGRYRLLQERVTINQPGMTQFERVIQTPPIPMRSTITLEVCNVHYQCDSATFNVRFNQTFKDMFGWCLALPFFVLVASYLWLLRNEDTVSLPTTVSKTHKWS